MRKILLIVLILTAFSVKINAQNVGLKTNLLYWATTSPNLGLEIGMGEQTTLDISAGFNPFKFSHSRQWKHWLVQPEFRYWTCERFNGHFLAAHLIGGGYNLCNLSAFPFSIWEGLDDARYKGHTFGGGIAYGYAWMLGKHWNLEAEVGVGYAHSWYDRYTGEDYNQKVVDSGNKNYWGITKLAISFVYLF
ncbi:MAG: DUF3575 domain-containing protein [Alistipes sp.]|nr:DUF3575 domain-containing protein [Alistipes sp.]